MKFRDENQTFGKVEGRKVDFFQNEGLEARSAHGPRLLHPELCLCLPTSHGPAGAVRACHGHSGRVAVMDRVEAMLVTRRVHRLVHLSVAAPGTDRRHSPLPLRGRYWSPTRRGQILPHAWDGRTGYGLCWVGLRHCLALFRPCLVAKNFQDFSSYRILQHMHGALNIHENKN